MSTSSREKGPGIIERAVLERVKAQCSNSSTDSNDKLRYLANGVPEVTVEEANMGSYIDSQIVKRTKKT